MDSLRPNASSAIAGVFPCQAAYLASDSQADLPLPAPAEIRRDSIRKLPHPAGYSNQGDSLSISPQARRLYDASAAPIGLAAENIALYNQIRRERDSLPPGDPRVMELTDKLRTVLAAGEEGVNAEDMDYRPPPAIRIADQIPIRAAGQAAPQSAGQVRPAGPAGLTTSKKRQPRHNPYSQDSGDVADFSFALPYPAPGASTEATPFFAKATASAAPRIHRAEPGTLERAPAAPPAYRPLYRVA